MVSTVQPFLPKYDVVVVGARCAGAATAMLLARHGVRVLALDNGRYGSDAVSTHALMRGGVLQLFRWGLLPGIIAAGTPPVRTTTFRYDDEVVEIEIKPRDGIDALYAPRRTVLDRMLVDAAVDAGVTVAHGVRLNRMIWSDAGRVGGVTVEDRDGRTHRILADIVVGADGLRSTVARLVSARTYRHGRYSGGVLYGYWRGLNVPGYEWHYRSRVAVGAIPTNDGMTCVFAGTGRDAFSGAFRGDVAVGYHRLLAEGAPSLAAKIAGEEPIGGFHGFAGTTGFFRDSWGPGWALVGDAGYFKDPITAHGITDALIDAEQLAGAVLDGTDAALAGYLRDRDARAGTLFEVTDAIASYTWTLPEVRRLHETLAKAMSQEAKAIGARAAGTGVQP